MAHITRRMQGRIDKLAHVMVLMERGEWEFPDKKPKWSKDADGRRVPRVVKEAAVKHVWETENPSHSMMDDLFSEKGRLHATLEERIGYHRQRLDDGYRQALATLTNDGQALTVMSSKVYESLWWDLNDPDTVKKVPFRDRVHFFEVLTKLNASIKGDVVSQGQHKLTPQVVIQNINVPDAVREQMMKNMESIEGEVEEAETSS